MPQQAAAIPFKRTPDGVSLCLITSRGSELWGVPKGTIDPGYSAEEAALQEALEEAGLEGRLLDGRIGTYDYVKNGVPLTVAVFLMEVEIEADEWDEQDLRRRRWVEPDEARRLLETHPVLSLVERACRRLGA